MSVGDAIGLVGGQPRTGRRTTVVNVRVDASDAYVGRRNLAYGFERSPWANPFPVRHESEQGAAIGRWRSRIARKGGLLRRRDELRGKRLGCWCAPLPCHADALAALAELDDDGVRAWIDAVVATEP